MSFKRVRFAVEASKEEEASMAFSKKAKRRKTVLPGPEDEEDELEGELTEGYRGLADVEDLLWDGEAEEAGPVKAVDPERAAAKRAVGRKNILRMACEEGGGLQEDIAAAEAEYTAFEDRRWNNSGVPLEPFSLRRERETGYFDEEGNYMAYADVEPEDAWLRALPKGPETGQEEDGDDDEGTDGAKAGTGAGAVPEPDAPDAGTLRALKEGVVELLQTGESVFGALRRLGGMQKKPRRSAQDGKGGASTVSPTQEQAQRMRTGRTVPAENRAAFDRLTELSSALLAAGDYHVHSAPRERLQADLRMHASGIPTGAAARPPPSRHPASDEATAQANAEATDAEHVQEAGAIPADPQGWRTFAARIEVPKTSSSSAAGGNASADADGSRAHAGAGEAASADGSTVATQLADPDEDIFGASGNSGGDIAWQGAAELASHAAALAAAAAGTGNPATSPAAAHAENQLPQSFAVPQQEVGADGGSPCVRRGSDDAAAGDGPQAPTRAARLCAAMEVGCEPATGSEREPSISVSEASQDTSMVYAEPLGVNEDNAEGPGTPMEGFEYDSASGYFYNSSMGAYFDPARRLFGDATSGRWYSLTDGVYQLVH